VVVRQSAIVFVSVVSSGGHRPSILKRIVVFPRRPAAPIIIAVGSYYMTVILLLFTAPSSISPLRPGDTILYQTVFRRYLSALSCARRRQLHNNNIIMALRLIRPGRANDGERLRRDDAKRRRARVLLIIFRKPNRRREVKFYYESQACDL